MPLPPRPIVVQPLRSPLQGGLVRSPVLTMGLVGAGIGGAVGYGIGGVAGLLLGRSLALKGAMLGAALAGAKGAQEGRELERWMRSL
jgi:hypothetical protein